MNNAITVPRYLSLLYYSAFIKKEKFDNKRKRVYVEHFPFVGFQVAYRWYIQDGLICK